MPKLKELISVVLLTVLALLAFSLALSARVYGAEYEFTQFDIEGAYSTGISRINNQGHLSGGFFVQGQPGIGEGFLLVGGKLTVLRYPKFSTDTGAVGLSSNDVVVGNFWDRAVTGKKGSFLYKKGKFSEIILPIPVAEDSELLVFDINTRGWIVGVTPDQRSFVLVDGELHFVEIPGAIGTQARAINDKGQVAGLYWGDDNVTHGFITRVGSEDDFIAINFPGALHTWVSGISAKGEVVGSYINDFSEPTGFHYANGTYETIGFPGALFTFPGGINGAGVIVGGFTDADGFHSHGFVAKVKK